MQDPGPSEEEDVGGDQKGVYVWKHPKSPLVGNMFGDERATEAVLAFLRDNKVGCVRGQPRTQACIAAIASPEEEVGEIVKGEEGRPSPP